MSEDHLSPPPPLRTWWFYTSPLPLDDPLSSLPQQVSPTAKHPPRPFSFKDCYALEAAYTSLLSREQDDDAISVQSSTVSNVSKRPLHKRVASKNAIAMMQNRGSAPHQASSAPSSSTLAEEGIARLRLGTTAKDITGSGTVTNVKIGSLENERGRDRFGREGRSDSISRHPPTRNRSYSPTRNNVHPSPSSLAARNKTMTTSNPFIRPPSRSPTRRLSPARPIKRRRSSQEDKLPHLELFEAEEEVLEEVPVGVQRLHKVLLPAFTMMPIYWDPVNDVAPVVRGTWFYKDTMLPVEAEVANRLEEGYMELRAWSEEWTLELNSAIEVGKEAEDKIRWSLYQKPVTPGSSATTSRPSTSNDFDKAYASSFEAKLDNKLTGSLNRRSTIGVTKALSEKSTTPPNGSVAPSVSSPFGTNDWVIYADEKTAYIGRDSMLLGFGSNKRPLQTIRKGGRVGTPVVRGFDVDEWVRLYPKKAPLKHPKHNKSRSTGGKDDSAESDMDFKPEYSATQITEEAADDGQVVTDLFLVIHGIGQKLSERVESFHFVHSVNALRKLVNAEMQDEAVKSVLRPEGVGIAMLPINWRSKISFEDATPGPDPVQNRNYFGLSDITPNSIPAVRNFVGDVMLDIPYYLSHHKRKMTRAVVAEANRVYNLWRKINPDFEKNGGRVHLIAHSLGSAISLDVLSSQPTTVRDQDTTTGEKGSVNKDSLRRASSRGPLKPWERIQSPMGPAPMKPKDEFLEFDISSLFCIGSPAAFFLLLNRGMLLPRKGKKSLGFGELVEDGIAGEAGTYGCLAVENVYNVLHWSDPIAYRLNPTVDVNYAESIKTAVLPSATASFFSNLSTSIWSVLPSTGSTSPTALPAPVSRLPSTIELETHDFTKEELAEKRMYLMNDNGQIDYYLSAGGGALENQYLNMIGSHGSYWDNRDFARMLVVEVGRKPGRANTLTSMRAVKTRK
ncbi:hypothetical protein BJ508DRAFT_325262 [Ascobolus immersus RN42]|uniref:DDHD domain-containing protein n=1 Tax=Ascobolus immersus RN42 TaxID=1160509 RepID=A0A3N4IF76_ASCIM|nr:hypothetical protein BJ508DRAFT_325262 [Ascobolus immersus RN42]